MIPLKNSKQNNNQPFTSLASPVQGNQYLGHNYNKADFLNDQLLREDTFSSLKSRPFTPNVAPMGTTLGSKSFDLTIETPGRPLATSPIRMVTPQPTPGLADILNSQTNNGPAPPTQSNVRPGWENL